MDVDQKRFVIDEVNKKVFNADGFDLKLLNIMMASGIIEWETNMDMRVQNRFKESLKGTSFESRLTPHRLKTGRDVLRL